MFVQRPPDDESSPTEAVCQTRGSWPEVWTGEDLLGGQLREDDRASQTDGRFVHRVSG